MMLTPYFAGFISLLVLVSGSAAASSDDYPNRPLRILTSAAGGSGDFASRLVAQGLSDSLGQQVIVDNRGGQSIPSEIVQRAPPDGYTMLLDGGSFWIGPLMVPTTYDVVRDFSPVTPVTISPGVFIMHPSVPATSIKEFVALAKAKPGSVNYSSGGTGSSSHLAFELFKAMAGVNVVRIAYKGTAPAVAGVISGEVQVMIPPAAGVAQHIQSGKLRVLAITSAQRSPAYPQFPTIAEAGVPGYEASSLQGLFVPVKTSSAVINRLNRESIRVLNRSDVKEKFLKAGLETYSSSPEQFASTIKTEIAKWGKVIKDAGIKAD